MAEITVFVLVMWHSILVTPGQPPVVGDGGVAVVRAKEQTFLLKEDCEKARKAIAVKLNGYDCAKVTIKAGAKK